MKRKEKPQHQSFKNLIDSLLKTIQELRARLTHKEKELEAQENTLERRVNVRTSAERVIHRQLHSEIEHREHLERMLEDTLEYATGIINTLRDPFVVLNEDLRVVSASPSFYQVFKVEKNETEGYHIYNLGDRQWDIPKLRELLEDILPRVTKFDNFEVEHNFPGIGRRTMLLNARKIFRRSDRIELILLAMVDITESKQAEEQLKRLATHDELTGCINFRSIMEILESEIARSKRYQKKFSIVMMDIDHFKSVNDAYGHLAGNDVLEAFARILRNSVRSVDIVGRYGGDEFLIIFPESDTKNTRGVLERVRKHFSRTKIVSRHIDEARELTLQFSAGIAVFSPEIGDIKELLSNADDALRRAKQKE
ncbi:MAG: sensor domain-containing diguanylate cyclase [Candidatus Omnitrophica bacterium]|nr:sensor domain-containing diguanylate cyclase [Candidatus Omnitrophota bacterium]